MGKFGALRDLICFGRILEGFLEMVDLEQGNKIRASPCQRQKNRKR